MQNNILCSFNIQKVQFRSTFALPHQVIDIIWNIARFRDPLHEIKTITSMIWDYELFYLPTRVSDYFLIISRKIHLFGKTEKCCVCCWIGKSFSVILYARIRETSFYFCICQRELPSAGNQPQRLRLQEDFIWLTFFPTFCTKTAREKVIIIQK